MAKKITQTAINSFIKSDKKELSDTEVEELKLTKRASKTIWRLRYKTLKGTRSYIKIVNYPDISLKIAREIAREYKELLARGIDPNDYKREK